jgi:uncharacterized ParB-like nuclease family protein
MPIVTKKVPLCLIAPLACSRPDDVERYVTRLEAGEEPPPVILIKQRSRRRYAYRIFDGAHRVRAARRADRKTIVARVACSD